MSTDFENAVIAFAQSLNANWGTSRERHRLMRRLFELIDSEYGVTCFGLAMKFIVSNAAEVLNV